MQRVVRLAAKKTPQAQFLEFLDKKNVVDMIIQVQHKAPEDLKVQKTAGATQV